jgi:hypothetical protein
MWITRLAHLIGWQPDWFKATIVLLFNTAAAVGYLAVVWRGAMGVRYACH